METNLTELTKSVSANILESIYLLEVLDELSDGEAKVSIIISTLQKNLKSAFDNISKCRTMISFPD